MRFSVPTVALLTIIASVKAAPQAYGLPPFSGAPGPVPGPGIALRSPVNAPQAPAPAAPGSSLATLTPVPPSSNPGHTGTAPAAQGQRCAADVDRLASGIQQNILVQQGELATAQSLHVFLQAAANGTSTGVGALAGGSTTTGATSLDKNMGQFIALKGQLLAFVNAGVAVRAGNQAIAPSGNMATNGLAQVANAQQMELAMASSLSGDATIDIPTIQSLLKAFSGGTKQNMQNLLDATQNCAPSDKIAQRGVQVALRAGLKAVAPVRTA
ncbi:hypothetical protein E6O75_ATG11291 [Venturia nashicola]|uniref:Cell wall protein n=1 Tax=Venturia nashicola TaxID=86259 RepID=A0A4Z1NR77_9PEZI|nr:hypothetical protein E6O75_ATG11291 [Venturia nashicola]